MQCARELAKRGYEVTVAGRRRGLFLQRIADAGLEILPLSLASDLTFGDVRRVRQWIATRCPNAMLCNFTRDVRVAKRAIRHDPGAETALVWITGSILLKKTRRHRLLVQRHVDRFIVPSRALKNEMLAFDYVPPAAIEVLPIGLELEKWPEPSTEDVDAARSRVGISKEQLVVGVFARLEPRKGQPSLFEAWGAVRMKHPATELWLVGTGSAEEEWRRLVRVRSIEGVKFVGFAANVRELILACDVVVQPSLYEPFGMTLLEAMACKKPVLCTRVGGMPEVVIEGLTALVVAPDAPRELAHALCLLLGDQPRRTALGVAGRRRVEQHFKLDTMIDRLETILRP